MSREDRILTFEVAGTVYGLPIEGVLEVAEAGRVSCVPTLPPFTAGVVNWHGQALPVLAPLPLLGREDEATEGLPDSEHVIVLSERGSETPVLGLPIDRVLGLVDGLVRRPVDGGDVVSERRRVRGRVVNVLDPRQLVARAERVIEAAAH